MHQEAACPFCLNNNLLRVEIIYENEQWYFTGPEENDPQSAGMAITKRHIETPFDINESEWKDLWDLLPKFKELISATSKPDGFNIGWNIGSAGGQTVFHAHLHIVPRYGDEPLAGKGIRYFFKGDSNRRRQAS